MKKTKRQKNKENPNSGLWKRKADKAWGRLIHTIYEACLVYGYRNAKCNGNLEAHHLISKGKVATRHCSENGVLLCSFHHKWSKDISPHMGPVGFVEFLREKYPKIIEWVNANQYSLQKPNYKESYLKLKEKLIELGAADGI